MRALPAGRPRHPRPPVRHPLPVVARAACSGAPSACGIVVRHRLDGQPGADAGGHRQGHRRRRRRAATPAPCSSGPGPARARRCCRRSPASCGTGCAVSNWLSPPTAPSRSPSARPAGSARRCPSRLATGEVVSIGTSDVSHIGNAIDITARGAGAVVAIVTVAVILLRAVGAARPGRGARRAGADGHRRAADPAAAPPPAGLPRAAGRADHPGRRHRRPGCGCCAASAARRPSSRALPRRVAAGAGGRRAGGPGRVAARGGPGAAARAVRGPGHLARRPVRGRRRDQRRASWSRSTATRSFLVLPAAHADRGGRQAHPRPRRRPAGWCGCCSLDPELADPAAPATPPDP